MNKKLSYNLCICCMLFLLLCILVCIKRHPSLFHELEVEKVLRHFTPSYKCGALLTPDIMALHGTWSNSSCKFGIKPTKTVPCALFAPFVWRDCYKYRPWSLHHCFQNFFNSAFIAKFLETWPITLTIQIIFEFYYIV